MTRAIHVTAGNHSGPAHLRGLELFTTPPGAVRALLAAESHLPHTLWDPCGPPDSPLAQTLETAGHRVVTHDFTCDGIDFRTRKKAPCGVKMIVTNPPFSLAADFVRHGLTLVSKVIVLERIQFYESEKRADIIEGGKLARIYAFADRVPRMHRLDWTGKRASPAMFLAWFVFDRSHRGGTEISRV